MRNTRKVYGDVASIDRAGAHHGNPTYRITLTGGTVYLTETDAQVGYAATNYRPNLDRPVVHVTLTLNERGRVIGIE